MAFLGGIFGAVRAARKAIKLVFNSFSSSADRLFFNIGQLDGNGEKKLKDKLTASSALSFSDLLKPIFSQDLADEKQNKVFEFDSLVFSKNDVKIKDDSADRISPAQAMKLALGFHANPRVIEGVTLQVYNDDGTVRDPKKYSDADRYNLSLAHAACRHMNINVLNAADIASGIAADIRTDASDALDAFVSAPAPDDQTAQVREDIAHLASIKDKKDDYLSQAFQPIVLEQEEEPAIEAPVAPVAAEPVADAVVVAEPVAVEEPIAPAPTPEANEGDGFEDFDADFGLPESADEELEIIEEEPEPEPDAAELAKIFDMPAGDMLEKLGVITPEQVEKSGEVQSHMLAVKLALQDETITPEAVIAQGLKNKEGDKPDLFGMIFKNADERRALMDTLGVSKNHWLDAIEKVGEREGVNQKGDAVFVPPMGVIHEKLKFYSAETKAASLTIQQSIRASETALRLLKGAANPELHAKKGEFNFDNSKDDPRLKDIQNLHKKLSAFESGLKPGMPVKPQQGALDILTKGFCDAAIMLRDAGHPALAEKAIKAANHYMAALGQPELKPEDVLAQNDIQQGPQDDIHQEPPAVRNNESLQEEPQAPSAPAPKDEPSAAEDNLDWLPSLSIVTEEPESTPAATENPAPEAPKENTPITAEEAETLRKKFDFDLSRVRDEAQRKLYEKAQMDLKMAEALLNSSEGVNGVNVSRALNNLLDSMDGFEKANHHLKGDIAKLHDYYKNALDAKLAAAPAASVAEEEIADGPSGVSLDLMGDDDDFSRPEAAYMESVSFENDSLYGFKYEDERCSLKHIKCFHRKDDSLNYIDYYYNKKTTHVNFYKDKKLSGVKYYDEDGGTPLYYEAYENGNITSVEQYKNGEWKELKNWLIGKNHRDEYVKNRSSMPHVQRAEAAEKEARRVEDLWNEQQARKNPAASASPDAERGASASPMGQDFSAAHTPQEAAAPQTSSVLDIEALKQMGVEERINALRNYVDGQTTLDENEMLRLIDNIISPDLKGIKSDALFFKLDGKVGQLQRAVKDRAGQKGGPEVHADEAKAKPILKPEHDDPSPVNTGAGTNIEGNTIHRPTTLTGDGNDTGEILYLGFPSADGLFLNTETDGNRRFYKIRLDTGGKTGRLYINGDDKGSMQRLTTKYDQGISSVAFIANHDHVKTGRHLRTLHPGTVLLGDDNSWHLRTKVVVEYTDEKGNPLSYTAKNLERIKEEYPSLLKNIAPERHQDSYPGRDMGM